MIQKLTTPTRVFGENTPVAPDTNAEVAKINELVDAVNAGLATSNAIVGGDKYVQYLSSQTYGVPADALTLERLDPSTIIPGTEATVINPHPTPLQATAPSTYYRATIAPAGTAGAVLVPAFTGSTDKVPVVWVEIVSNDSFTPLLASELNLGKGAYASLDLRPLLIALVNGIGTGSSTVITTPATTQPATGPTVTGFLPDSAAVGASVTLTGTGFTKATAVLFNGTPASFQVVNATTILAVVPIGATTGPVAVTNSAGTATSAASFTVNEPVVVTPPPATTTPDAPFPSFDPTTRTLTYQHALGTSELEINHLGGSYQPYAPVSVDDGSHNAGEWKARVRAATGRNASGSADSPAIAAKAVVNQLPVANAGDDLTITLPTSSAALMGAASDPDPGDTLTYFWRPINGPNTPLGLPASTLNVVVSNLTAGTYQFGFQATDQKGGKSPEDFVVVTVKPQPTTTPGGWDGRPVLIICEGDSTTEGYINTRPVDPATSYPGRLQVALGSNFVVVNKGIGGTDTKQMLDRAAANIDTLYDPATYYATYYFLHGGINNYLIPHNPAYTVEQTLSELRQNLQGRQAKGMRAVACTVIPSNQPFEGSMQAINAAMRAQYTSWGIEGLCDFRKTPGYETYNGTSVGSFQDGVHRNDLGYQLMARDVRDSIKALIAPLGVPVPNYLFPFEGGTTTPAPGADTITISSVDVIDDYITIDSVTVL